MLKPLLLTALSCTLLLTTWPADAVAQNRKNQTKAQKQDERRENEAVEKAKKNVDEAQKALREVERSVKQALDKLKEAERDQSRAAGQLQKLRDELEAKHADLTGLSEARRRLSEAQKAYDKMGAPFLKQVAETAKYKEALEAAKSAERRLAAIREDSIGDADERRKRLAEASKLKLVPSQLEREALDAEPSLKPERTNLKAAEEAVAKAHDAMEKAVEKDSALKGAKDSFESAKKSVAEARRAADKEERELASARQKLARENQDLQQKITADRKDDNKGKNKKN